MNHPPEDWIEDGLRTYPLALPPRDLAVRILSEVKSTRPVEKFRLTWIDFALVLLALLVTGLVVYLLPFIPESFWLQMEFKWLLLQTPSLQPVLLSLVAAGAALASLAMAAILQVARKGGLF